MVIYVIIITTARTDRQAPPHLQREGEIQEGERHESHLEEGRKNKGQKMQMCGYMHVLKGGKAFVAARDVELFDEQHAPLMEQVERTNPFYKPPHPSLGTSLD